MPLPHTSPAALFKEGLALHQRGQLAQAKAIYEQVLTLEPKHFDALHLLGVIAAQSKNHLRAVDMMRRALAINAKHAATHYNLAVALRKLKQFDEALSHFERAVELQPQYPDAYLNWGHTLMEMQQAANALACYDRALACRPGHAQTHFHRAIALQTLDRPADAVASYDEVIALSPGSAQAHYNRGNALWKLNRLEEALACYKQTIAIDPQYVMAYSNMGNTLQELRRHEEALACYQQAIALKPDFAEAYSNLGNALLKLNRTEQAIANYERALALEPHFAQAHCNLGNAMHAQNRLEDALASYERALAIEPTHGGALWNKAIVFLMQGELLKGWELYEWRWEDTRTRQKSRPRIERQWTGEQDLHNKTIVITTEQGFGDAIQFCRYVPLLKAHGAHVVFQTSEPLRSLLENFDGIDELINPDSELPAHDFVCPLMSLALAFKTELHTIPSPTPYLRAAPHKREEWARRIGPKTRPRIGLVWSGSTIHKNDHNRSLALQMLQQHLPADFDYVSLQKEVRTSDLPVLTASGIQNHATHLHDFSDTAALCDLMDLIISVDTSVAHLAGALGKPTWVLLPFAPDWRWLLNREDSPWYSSVKLFRQSQSKEWPSVLRRVAHDLKTRLPQP